MFPNICGCLRTWDIFSSDGGLKRPILDSKTTWFGADWLEPGKLRITLYHVQYIYICTQYGLLYALIVWLSQEHKPRCTTQTLPPSCSSVASTFIPNGWMIGRQKAEIGGLKCPSIFGNLSQQSPTYPCAPGNLACYAKHWRSPCGKLEILVFVRRQSSPCEEMSGKS